MAANIDSIILLGVIYFMLYSSIFWLLLFFEKKKNIKQDPEPTKTPLVSVIIPVYKNDTAELVKRAVVSCLAIDYPKKEIILAWNGPDGQAMDVCKEFEKKKLIRFLQTSKKGKAAGMNLGIEHAKGEYFCCLDADSFFKRDALQYMVGYFDDPKVGAVTSSMKIWNPKNWIQKLQWMEYIFAIYLRRLMSLINCLYVVPGPGSMYRTSIVKKIGGFDEQNLTEDMEIAFRMQKHGYKIKNGINAIVDTIAPKTIQGLIKQRIRWYAGFCDNLVKYKSFMLNPKHGSLGMYIIPSSLLWIGVLFYTLGRAGWLIIDGLIPGLKTWLLTGIHLDIWFKNLFSFSFEPTFLTVFMAALLIVGITVMYYSLRVSNEKIDFKNKYIHYTVFLSVYTIFLGVFWIFALGYFVMYRQNKEMMRW